MKLKYTDMKEEQEKLDFDKVWLLFQQTEKQMKETDTRMKETDVRMKETDAKLKELGRQIGAFHQERGTYTEILLMPSIKSILMDNFDYDHFLADVRKSIRHESIQLDAIGYTNGERNELMIVEVKTTLRNKDIDQLDNHLSRFDTFFPEYGGKKKYGMLVAMQADRSMIAEVHNAGFYYAGIDNDMIYLDNPIDFVAKVY